jgi:hypothetical protein
VEQEIGYGAEREAKNTHHPYVKLWREELEQL